MPTVRLRNVDPVGNLTGEVEVHNDTNEFISDLTFDVSVDYDAGISGTLEGHGVILDPGETFTRSFSDSPPEEATEFELTARIFNGTSDQDVVSGSLLEGGNGGGNGGGGGETGDGFSTVGAAVLGGAAFWWFFIRDDEDEQ